MVAAIKATINISMETFNISTKVVRLQKTSKANLRETNMESMNIYYYCVHADDNYIYATYFFSVWSDPIRNRLYTINMNNDEVYYINIDKYI